MALSRNTDGLAKPQPASPKLGNFSRIFNDLLAPKELKKLDATNSSDCETAAPYASSSSTLTTPTTPTVEARSIVRASPYEGGFFNGLDISSFDIQEQVVDESVSSDDDDDDGLTRCYGSSIADNSSTAASSPPSYLERQIVHEIKDTTNIPHLVGLPIWGGPYNTDIISTVVVPYSLAAQNLSTARLYEFAPRIVDRDCILPLYLSTRSDKMNLLTARLVFQYELDARQAIVKSATSMPSLHVFVDLSNIIIGFYDCLKRKRGISLQKKLKAAPFFFDGFAEILERGRPVERKIIAGSAIDNADRAKWPVYMREAEQRGYEMNILSRVTKTLATSKRRPRRGNRTATTGDWTTSDANSSDDIFVGHARQGEQGVDEILHLKICNSLLDHEPSTIVLATGDAAEAEFSDGFLKHVERALARGWCVELLSWRKGISSSWRALQRSKQWKGCFRIIELDDFVEELMAVFIDV